MVARSDYFDFGVSHLKPLKMQEIADELGIHVSTVSRAISDKYLQSHRGIKPLKFFFTGGTETEDGTVESRVSVKEKVKALSAAAKASAMIIGALAFIVMVRVYVTRPDYIMTLFTDPMGHLILIGAAVMMGTGIMVMRNRINFKV